MTVEKFKAVIWAADVARAVGFYEAVLGGRVTRDIGVIVELEIAGTAVSVHTGGEGSHAKRTWTAMSFQVADVVAGAAAVRAAGGLCEREPRDEDGEPPHLAICVDTEGNEFMLTRKRS